jgi:septal ring factor EnvC (AmiA/AmiB activator)
MTRVLVFLFFLSISPAAAEQDAGAQANAAAKALSAATAQLTEAASARDQVRALTQTIQAFEDGLAAMRSGLRQVSIAEAQLSASLAARDEEIETLLVALQNIGSQGSPVALLHPGGPTGTARAGMLLADITPALNAKAAAVRQDLEDVQVLRDLQTDAAARLQLGLQQVQEARTALNTAIANRTELPSRFTNDPVRTAILIASSETLDGFASGLSRLVVDETDAPDLSLNDRKGAMSLPVQAVVLRRPGEADAAGVKRPGLILATRPLAIVTSPSAATIRYTGPLLDLGQVVILEPQADTLFIFAGLDVVYGEAGQVIDEGEPLGLMGAKEATNGSELSTDGEATGADRTETLYIEVRQDNTPQDPTEWFRTDKDG